VLMPVQRLATCALLFCSSHLKVVSLDVCIAKASDDARSVASKGCCCLLHHMGLQLHRFVFGAQLDLSVCNITPSTFHLAALLHMVK